MTTFATAVKQALTNLNTTVESATEFSFDGRDYSLEFDPSDVTIHLFDENGNTIVIYDFEEADFDYIVKDADSIWTYLCNNYVNYA